MAHVFKLPAVGDTMVEGEIVEWFVSVGDVVDLDQVICTLETDKSIVEMSTPHRGTVLKLGADRGGVVEVGAPLLIVGEPGEAVPDLATPVAPDAPVSAKPPITTTPTQLETAAGATQVFSPVLRRLAAERGVELSSITGSGIGGRITRADIEGAAPSTPTEGRISPILAAPVRGGAVRAMPKVRKAARDRAIDLGAIVGTGPRGSITLEDLSSADPVRGRRVRLSAMRRTIAERLTRSVREIPQFTSIVEFDATALLASRDAARAASPDPIPIDAVLMRALVDVLADHPLMNSRLAGDEIEYFDSYDIGVAVDTPGGLMVPVLADASERDLDDIAGEIVRLATAARQRTIDPAELTGATCTLNNVGALGILAGTPILPVDTSTIVAFGAARPVVQLRGGEPVEIPRVTISATFDHRLIDGGDSARFLGDLVSRLEQ